MEEINYPPPLPLMSTHPQSSFIRHCDWCGFFSPLWLAQESPLWLVQNDVESVDIVTSPLFAQSWGQIWPPSPLLYYATARVTTEKYSSAPSPFPALKKNATKLKWMSLHPSSMWSTTLLSPPFDTVHTKSWLLHSVSSSGAADIYNSGGCR